MYNSFALLLAVWCVVPIAVTSVYGVSVDQIKRDKLTDPETILSAFRSDTESHEVLVHLQDEASAESAGRWRSLPLRKQMRERIQTRQQLFLDTLGDCPLLIRHRLKNQLTVSAYVSLETLDVLSTHPMVESIEPVVYFEPHVSQGIALMNAADARLTFSGQGVSVAICDTGIDYTHPALGGGGFPNEKVIGGYDFGDNDANPMPAGSAHGTCCAGMAAGDVVMVGDYIGGVAYNAKLYALKITPDSGTSASNIDIAAAWDWCVEHQYDDPSNPIMVISTSFGGSRYYSACDIYSITLKTAAENAVAAGITLLASSGNDGYCDSISMPACVSDVISVGAVWDASVGTYSFCVSDGSCAAVGGTSSCDTGEYSASQTSGPDLVTAYSNTATFLDVLAPSHLAYTTDIVGSGGYSSGDYNSSFGGTSAACPYAAGAVACIQSAAKASTGAFLTPAEVRQLLTSTGDGVTDPKVAITKPRVNLGHAVSGFSASPPVAQDQQVTFMVDVPETITLIADDEGLPDPPGLLNYTITSLPNHGILADPDASVITQVPYTLVSNGNQVIYSPKSNCAAPGLFTFKASDGGVWPDGGDSNEATVTMAVSSIITLYEANMDTNPGWTFDVGSDWAWGVPAGSSGDPSSGATGGQVVGYNLTGSYANNMSSTLWATTPLIDCAGHTGVTLQFERWLCVEQSAKDHAYLQCSNNETSWTTIWQNSSTIYDTSWSHQIVDISAIADNQSTVYLRWGIGTTDSRNPYAGWNIDDVIVNGEGQFETLAGDFEPDCDIDAADLARLIAYWLQSCGDCDGADLLADGIVNLEDFRILAENWLVEY